MCHGKFHKSCQQTQGATSPQEVSGTYYKSNGKFPWSERYLRYKELGSRDTHRENCVTYPLPT